MHGMTITTKSIFQPADEGDGLRVLITRYYPRGVRKTHFDYWIQALAPSRDLLLQYKEGKVGWSEFKTNFLAEIRDNNDSLDAIHALNDYGRSEKITLLCYEKAGNPCHRHLVRDVVADPSLLSAHFEPEDTDNHEGIPVEELIANQKTLDLPTINS
jgi:uncharacterized protein YeaO (DUF488 family)